MKRVFWIAWLLPASVLFARDHRLRGYILDGPAFQGIRTYCFDTHNQAPREARVIEHLIFRESRATGLFAQLPWRRIENCQAQEPDAYVRVEFPPSKTLTGFLRRDVNGVLFVLRSSSPSPIYETREVLMGGYADGIYDPPAVEFLERNAAGIAFRAVVHDWREFSESHRASMH